MAEGQVGKWDHRADGFQCRFCGCRVSKVTNTWTYTITYYGKQHVKVKRRRICHNCKLPFTTIETIEDDENPGNPELVTPPPLPPPVGPSAFINTNKNHPPANTSPKENSAAAKRKSKGKNPYL